MNGDALLLADFVAGICPFLGVLSAISLFVLYSIRFCSKLGSFKYSSNDPARDTGAWSLD